MGSGAGVLTGASATLAGAAREGACGAWASARGTPSDTALVGLAAGVDLGSATALFADFVEAVGGTIPPNAAGGAAAGAPPNSAGSISSGAIRVGVAELCAIALPE